MSEKAIKDRQALLDKLALAEAKIRELQWDAHSGLYIARMTTNQLDTAIDTEAINAWDLGLDTTPTLDALFEERSARRCLECRRVRALQPDGLCRECAEHNEADHEPDMAEDY